jgi:cell division protein FtsI (penicillin-binding protein 3)
MLGRTDSRRRLLLLLVVFLVGSLALITRTAYWQVVERDKLTLAAARQTTVRLEVPSRRGEIYDRTGTVLLATTVERDRLVAAADQLAKSAEKRRATTDELIRMLELDQEAGAVLREKLASGKPYVIVARNIKPEMAEQIRQGLRDRRLFALNLEPEPLRVYPQEGGGPDSTLAAHLLGFVNRESQGQYGVEQAYQDVLAGTPKLLVSQRDVNGRPMPETATLEEPGVIGEDVTLTIDAGLQLALEQELLAAWIADKAKSVSAVVMDPYTGEVYAEATYPSYDGNQYRAVADDDPGRFIDPVISSVYEPGSVFKMMTAAAALENKSVTMTTRIKDVGTLRLDKGTSKVDDADRRGMGWMSFRDAIAWSRNVVAAKVALGLSNSTAKSAAILHDMWARLGYGAPTGIDLAGEVQGIVRDPGIRRWAQIDLANGAFGQGVAVTPIQLATAYGTLMNGGVAIQPHVVKAIAERDVPTTKGERVISRGLSRSLVRLMEHVVTSVPFYRNRTLVPGYFVGGKTGTAQIWNPKARGGRGDWKHNLFNYSFVGYIGREKGVPDLVVAVRIEEGTPTVARVGQLEMPVMSFELFRRIATNAITTPDLLNDRPEPVIEDGPSSADR